MYLLNRCIDRVFAFYSQRFYCTYSNKHSWRSSSPLLPVWSICHALALALCSVIINYTNTLKSTDKRSLSILQSLIMYSNVRPWGPLNTRFQYQSSPLPGHYKGLCCLLFVILILWWQCVTHLNSATCHLCINNGALVCVCVRVMWQYLPGCKMVKTWSKLII